MTSNLGSCDDSGQAVPYVHLRKRMGTRLGLGIEDAGRHADVDAPHLAVALRVQTVHLHPIACVSKVSLAAGKVGRAGGHDCT